MKVYIFLFFYYIIEPLLTLTRDMHNKLKFNYNPLISFSRDFTFEQNPIKVVNYCC